MKESDYKTKWCKQIRDAGGYARRLEDQFGLGMPDMLWALVGGHSPLLVEAKIIRRAWFGPTPRQLVELKRINDTGLMVGIVLGYNPTTKVFYYGMPAERLYTAESLSASTFPSLLEKLTIL